MEEGGLFLVVVVYKLYCFVADFEEGSSSACLVKLRCTALTAGQDAREWRLVECDEVV